MDITMEFRSVGHHSAQLRHGQQNPKHDSDVLQRFEQHLFAPSPIHLVLLREDDHANRAVRQEPVDSEQEHRVRARGAGSTDVHLEMAHGRRVGGAVAVVIVVAVVVDDDDALSDGRVQYEGRGVLDDGRRADAERVVGIVLDADGGW